MKLRSLAAQLLRKMGYDTFRTHEKLYIIRGNDTAFKVVRRLKLMKHHNINLVFDVGASVGGWALGVKRRGYKGRTVSFEPLSSAFCQLEKHARKDPLWEVANIGLGHENTKTQINISGYSDASSLLEIVPSYVEFAPVVAYTGAEKITVRTLDSIFHNYYRNGERVYLKIDAQGFEKNILEGACESLKDIIGVQLEMSLVQLYQGETLFPEMLEYMSENGFTLMGLETGLINQETGQLMQVDGIFYRV